MDKKIVIIGLVIILLFTSGCVQNQESKTDKINVLVSILPQKEFVNIVGKDRIDVQELIPPGASPATYSPKPSELANIENAKIYFRIGLLPFEDAHTETFISLNSKLKIVNASDVTELRQFETNDKTDPHLWLAPENAKKHVEQIYQTLAEMNPENKEYYRQNADNYISKLEELDYELKQKFSDINTKNIMVFHPAWGYLADAYGLKQIAIEQSGKDPTAKELAELVDFAKENNIKIIFVQKQFSTQSAEALATELGAIVVQIDPLAENYLENMSNIGLEITKQLS